MSIRNKRLFIEQFKLCDYEIYWPADWSLKEEVHIQTVQKDIHLYLKIDNKYPFTYPKMLVQNIDYIQWLLNENSKHLKFINQLNIKIPCVCCETITCRWSPSYGIKQMIDEFNNYYKIYYLLEKYKIIYNKINGFDDLIYKNIFNFLYL